MHFFTSRICCQFTFRYFYFFCLAFVLSALSGSNNVKASPYPFANDSPYRQRISINEGWRFMHYRNDPDSLIYDIRPDVINRKDNIVADTKPSESSIAMASDNVLKKWILPSANDFIKDSSKQYQSPEGNLGKDFPFMQNNFDDHAPAYSQLKGIRTSPLYSAFQKQFPDKMIQSSETSSALSTRGTFLFPLAEGISAPVSDSTGGDSPNKFVSAYDLYTAAFGASPDKVFYAQNHNPFVAGEFVWSGWDYLGEPTPYYSARSSYSGIIDLGGFKKDRYYLYQFRWRPNLPMAHILPHWTWPNRVGKITPVHVYTSGDEAELFLNGKSLGRKKCSMNTGFVGIV